MAKVTYVLSNGSSQTDNRSAPIFNSGLVNWQAYTGSDLGRFMNRNAGTFSRFFGYKTIGGAGKEITLYDYTGGTTLESLSITANTLSEDNSTTQSLSASNAYSIRDLASTARTTKFIGFTYEPSSGHYTVIGCYGASSLTENSVTRYAVAQGQMALNTTDTTAYRLPVDITCTAKNMHVLVYTNGRITNTTYHFRKNGADGNGTIVVSGGSTGHFVDSTNTDSLVQGDEFNYSRAVLTGSGAIANGSIGVELHSTSTQHHMYGMEGTNADRPLVDSTTVKYFVPFGGMGALTTTEAETKIPMGHSGNASYFRIKVAGSTTTNDGTITVRKNGTDVATITVTAGINGIFSDTSSTFSFVAGDLISCSAKLNSGTGSFNIVYFSMVVSQGATVVTPNVQSVVFSLPSRTIIGKANVTPNVLSLVASLPSRKIIMTTKPNVLSAVFSLPSRTIIGKANVFPNVASAVFSLPSRKVIITVKPNVIFARFTLPTYAILTGLKVIPNVLTAIFSLPTRAVIISKTVNVISAVFSLPTPTVLTPASGTTVSVAVKSLVFSLPSRNIFTPNSLALASASSQYASIPDASQTGLNITGDISVEAWVRWTSLPSSANQMIIASKNGGSGNYGWYFSLYNSSGTMRLRLFYSSNGSNTDAIEVDFLPAPNIWYHVAVTKTGTSVKFYVNGRQLGTTQTSSFSSINASTDIFSIGASKTTTSGGVDSFTNGYIDNVRIFNDVRTASEIQADAHATTVSDANLKGEWRFDNNYVDTSGNNNTLSGSGSPTFSTNIPWEHASKVQGSTYLETNLIGYWALENTSDSKGTRTLTNNGSTTFPTGKVNNGASFNGSSKYLSRATETLGIANAWSIAFWVKFNATGVNEPIIWWANPSNQNNQIGISKKTSDILRATIVDPTSANYKDYEAQNTTFTSGVWYHVAITWDGSYLWFYINGFLENTTKVLDQVVTQTDTSRVLGIGGFNGSTDRKSVV